MRRWRRGGGRCVRSMGLRLASGGMGGGGRKCWRRRGGSLRRSPYLSHSINIFCVSRFAITRAGEVGGQRKEEDVEKERKEKRVFFVLLRFRLTSTAPVLADSLVASISWFCAWRAEEAAKDMRRGGRNWFDWSSSRFTALFVRRAYSGAVRTTLLPMHQLWTRHAFPFTLPVPHQSHPHVTASTTTRSSQ